MNVAVLIVAAGRGTRARSAALPKQYVDLGGRTVLQRSMDAFAEIARVRTLLAVIHSDDLELYRSAVSPASKLLPPATGGDSRQESVRAGLEALASHSPDIVLIHDAARPFIDAAIVDRIIDAVSPGCGAIAAVPLADTLKRVDRETGVVAGTVDRAGLWRAQTPQAFRFDEILSAHRAAAAAGRTDFTDDAAVAEWAGHSVRAVESTDRNIKLTTAEDIAMAQASMSGPLRETRSASGFDVHRFADGDAVHLCGVKIPHTQRLEGHSDADVGLHALTDALLGTIGAGDIGQHFPPSDPQWKGASSDIFLAHAAKLVRERGGRIVNVDVTILAEAPRVGPHRAEMCRRMAEILAVDVSRVSVKATTTEGLGFTGRREGIAAMATASVELDRVD